nr:DNA-binding protein [Pseudomonas putida]
MPENDVFAAADAVLSRGERPTVERVRLELGRGSPARVGALLDQWWEQLAGRLRGESRLPGLPAGVAQAFVAIWQEATTMAQAVVEQSVAGQREVLANEREQLAQLEARVRLEAAQARQQTAEAVTARQAAETRLSDLNQLLEQRLAQIDDLHQQRTELQDLREELLKQIQALQGELQETQAQAEQARIAQETYVRGVEERAHREVDRAREESKGRLADLQGLKSQHADLQRKLDDARSALSAAQQQAAIQQTRAHSAIELAQQQTQALNAQLLTAQQSLEAAKQDAAANLARAIEQQSRADTLDTQLGLIRADLARKESATGQAQDPAS